DAAGEPRLRRARPDRRPCRRAAHRVARARGRTVAHRARPQRAAVPVLPAPAGQCLRGGLSAASPPVLPVRRPGIRLRLDEPPLRTGANAGRGTVGHAAMTSRSAAECVIVGAGPAGLAAAYELTKHGVAPVV